MIESKFRAAVDAATDGLAITDSEGCYTYLNPAHVEMFGYGLEELLGRSWRTIYSDEEGARIEAVAIPTMLQHGAWRGEAVGRHKNGAPVYQEVVLSQHPHGGIICSTRDVSERRDQERKTRLLESRLRVAERSEVMFSIHNSLTHDFGNLIAAIDGFARLIQQSPTEVAANTARIDAIIKATEQAFDLIRLTAPSEDHVAAATGLDVVSMLRTAVGIANALKPDGVRVSCDFETESAMVLANEVLLARSFLNVIKNAIEALDEGGRLAVRLQRVASPALADSVVRNLGPDLSGYSWVVEVEDSGEGMSANRLDAVLTQRFTSKQRQAGRGLGLESVIGLAETGLVGVEIQTAEGRGTRFVFRFVDEDADDPSIVEESPVARAATQRAKVFVVDDNELVASMLVQTLTASGFDAEYALSGEKALASETSSFDAVVTDFRMPGMDGHELAVRLKAAHPGLPIIIYSGQGGHIAHSALFSAVLSKPIKPAELVNAVRQSIANAV